MSQLASMCIIVKCHTFLNIELKNTCFGTDYRSIIVCDDDILVLHD